MNSVSDRISFLMKQKGLKQVDIINATEASKGTVSKWISGVNVPSSEHLNKLVKLLGTNTDYLLLGKGNPNDQHITVSSVANVEKLPVRKIRQVPVLNWVQAGSFTGIGDNTYDEFEPVFEDDYGSKNIYWLKICGDSMKPAFNAGDLILIDADRTATAGNFVIAKVCDDEEATFKKFKPCGFDDNGKEYFQLIALNDFYPPIDSRYKPFEVIGVVVEHKRKLI